MGCRSLPCCLVLMLLLLMLLALCTACAVNTPGGPGGPDVSLSALPALARHWPEEDRVFRHAVRLDIAGTSFSCDGVMRMQRGASGPEIRIVCLGALGLTLCDMTVTPDDFQVTVLHPSLARVPRVAEHIALCVRSVWFASLALTEQERTAGTVREIYRGMELEHSADAAGQRTVRSPGPDAWSLRYTPGDPQPERLEFQNEDDGYTVTIRLVS